MNSEELAQELSFITTIPHDVSITGLFLGIPIILCGLLGNVLIVVAIVKDKRLRWRQNVFVASLAISDIAVVLTSDAFFIITYGEQRWRFSGAAALLLMVLRTFQNQSSIGHILAITIYRYALVVHNRAYRVMAKLPVLISVLLFLYLYPILSGLASVGKAFDDSADIDVFMTVNTKTMSAVTPERFLLTVASSNSSNATTADSKKAKRPDVLLYVVIYLLVHAAILVVCYVHTYVFVRRSSARLQAWGDGQAGENATTNRMTVREVKFIKTMAIVFVTFVFSYFWMPTLAAIDYQSRFSHWVYFPFLMLNWASSSVNWIVYGLTNAMFREAFKKVLKCKLHSVDSTSQVDPGSVAQTRT